jgi:hypothetical protein
MLYRQQYISTLQTYIDNLRVSCNILTIHLALKCLSEMVSYLVTHLQVLTITAELLIFSERN